jgi:hypothetical protein
MLRWSSFLRRLAPTTRRDEVYFLLQRSTFGKTTFPFAAPFGDDGKPLLKKRYSHRYLPGFVGWASI